VSYDILFAGGGLSSVLSALAILRRWPTCRLLIVEQGDTLGAEHTWSFHHSDLTDAQHQHLAPFIVKSWAGQSVRFPGFQRTLDVPYHTISSQRLHAVAMETLGEHVRLGVSVNDLDREGMTLSHGERIEGACVFDGRGPQPTEHLALAFQSFVGLDLELKAPHGLTAPVIMDATVEQLDGYRFVYLLPYDERRVLVEDTYYTPSSGLDVPTVRARARTYAEQQGWQVAREVSVETGVLPLMLGGDIESFYADHVDGPVPIGLRAALFHSVTGYSLPNAVRLADVIADAFSARGTQIHTRDLREVVLAHGRTHWRQQAYYRVLNRMLFLAANGEERRGIFERFYGLSTALIQRFYAGQSSAWDKMRILVGKPPIPIVAAMRVLPPSAATAPLKSTGC
jgi:lycopene beta-cyclase